MWVVQLLVHREWTEDGQLWVQYVSSTPATRLDVINLQERLDQQLQQRQVWLAAIHSCCICSNLIYPCICSWMNDWVLCGFFCDPSEIEVFLQARETGICPVREELYAQCFDEIIREVTINCAERGLLLLRVRDELRMTIAAYQVCSAPIPDEGA